MEKQGMYVAVSIFCLVVYFLLFGAGFLDVYGLVDYGTPEFIIGFLAIIFFLLGVTAALHLLRKGEEAILKKVKVILNLFYLPFVLSFFAILAIVIIPALKIGGARNLGPYILFSVMLSTLILILILILINFLYKRTWSHTDLSLALAYNIFMEVMCSFFLVILTIFMTDHALM